MSEYVFSCDKIESCVECPFVVERNRFDGNEWHCYCRLSGKEVSDDGEKAEDCPLKELQSHGRLIDADKLKSKIIRERDGKGLMSLQATKKYNFALDKIFDAPTILEASE